jgi:hypothetical protein
MHNVFGESKEELNPEKNTGECKLWEEARQEKEEFRKEGV